jgi:hypothetical protein
LRKNCGWASARLTAKPDRIARSLAGHYFVPPFLTAPDCQFNKQLLFI